EQNKKRDVPKLGIFEDHAARFVFRLKNGGRWRKPARQSERDHQRKQKQEQPRPLKKRKEEIEQKEKKKKKRGETQKFRLGPKTRKRRRRDRGKQNEKIKIGIEADKIQMKIIELGIGYVLAERESQSEINGERLDAESDKASDDLRRRQLIPPV